MTMEPLSRSEWQVMRVCWGTGPSDARTLHAASLAEASPLKRLIGVWQLQTFRTALERIVRKGYLRVQPAIEVAVTGRGEDKWAVIDYVATLFDGDRARAAAAVQACHAARPLVVLSTLNSRQAASVGERLEKLGARVIRREGPSMFEATVSIEDAIKDRSDIFIEETVGSSPEALRALRQAIDEHERTHAPARRRASRASGRED